MSGNRKRGDSDRAVRRLEPAPKSSTFAPLVYLRHAAAAQPAPAASCCKRRGSDPPADQQSVDITRSLSTLDAVFGGKLPHQIVVVLERGQIILGKFSPSRPNFPENDFFGLGGRPG